MSADIASLGIKVDARQVSDADKTLQNLTQSGQSAEKQTGLLSTAAERLARMFGMVSAAQKLADDATRAATASTGALTLGQAQLIERFNEQAKTIGMSRSQLMAYQAAQLGVTEQTRAAVAAVKAHEDALKAEVDAKRKSSDSSGLLAASVKMLAAAYATLKVADFVKDSALLAARYETLGVVMTVVGRTAGYTKTQMDVAAEGIAAQGITMVTARESAVKLVQAHIDLSNASKLARIAQDAAVIGNINSSEAFERLVNGVSRGNVLILRNIGINVNLQAAYEKMATSLGKNKDDLTENERVQARLNAVLERGTDIAGTYEAAMGTAGKQLLSMQRYTTDLKTKLGEVFNESLTIGVMALTDHLKDANGEVSELAKNHQLEEWGHDLTQVFVTIANSASNVYTTFEKLQAFVGHFSARRSINADFDAQSKAVSDTGNGMAEPGAVDKINRIEAARAAALAFENSEYTRQQLELSGNIDRFERAADERAAARLAKQKQDAADRLKVDQDYMTRAMAIANSGMSLEAQRAAQAKLAQSVYVGVPSYRDSKPEDSSDADKEATAYTNLITKIRTKIAENNLELKVGQNLSESQRAQIELNEQLANKKVKLSAAHVATAEAAIKELSATEALLKGQEAQRDVTRYIDASTEARKQSAAALDVEYKMYGKSSDARAIEMVAVDSEKWKQTELADLRKKHLPITDEIIAQLNAEAYARTQVGQATLGQTKALQYAEQLHQENQKFSVDYTLDPKAKAKAQLAIDQAMWQQRIALAGEGTVAREKIEGEYTQWLQNQQIKPQLDAQIAMWDSIEKTAHDTFVNILRSGKSAAQALRDTLKNVLFDWLYQMTLKKWIVQIQGQLIGGAPAATGDALTAAASASSNPLIQAASAASSLYKAAAGIGDTAAAMLGKGVSYLGNAVGSSDVATFGKGMQGFGQDGSLGQMAGYGQTAGTVVGGIGNVAAGYMMGSTLNGAISGQYSTGSGMMTTEKIATAVASYFNPLLGAAVGAVSGLINRAFGMGSTELKASGLRGTLSASGVTGNTYSDYHQDGGWFRSDKNWTDTKALTDAMSSQLVQAFQAIKDASGGFAKTLGVNTDALSTYSKAFDIAMTGDAAKDQAAVTDFFKGVGDDVAKLLVPNLDSFSQSGETASATLERLAGEFTATTTAAQSLGRTAAQMFGSAGMGSAAARDRLVQLAGGTSALTSLADTFNKDFLTDAERLVPVSKALDAALGSLGLTTIPTTNEQFKALVQSLDPTNESSAKLLVSLLQLSDAFYQVHKSADDTATALADKLDGAMTALQHAVDAQKTVLKNAYDATVKELQTAIDNTQGSVTKLTDLSKALHDAVSQAAGVDMSRAAGQAQIRAALAIAKAGGPLPTADSLKSALSAVTADSKNQFSTFEAYQRDRLQTAIDISSLASVSDDQLSTADKQLAVLKAAKDAADAAYNAEVARLDAIVSTAQRQVDAINGVDVSVQSVEQAVAALQALFGGSNAAAIVGAYGNALGRAPDAAGLSYWQGQAAAGMSNENITKGIGTSSEASSKLDDLYEKVFGRHGDSAGMSYWLQQLGNGTSLGQIEAAFRNSSEAKDNILSTPGSLASTSSGATATIDTAAVSQAVADALKVPLAKIASYTQRTAKGIEDQNSGTTLVDLQSA